MNTFWIVVCTVAGVLLVPVLWSVVAYLWYAITK